MLMTNFQHLEYMSPEDGLTRGLKGNPVCAPSFISIMRQKGTLLVFCRRKAPKTKLIGGLEATDYVVSTWYAVRTAFEV